MARLIRENLNSGERLHLRLSPWTVEGWEPFPVYCIIVCSMQNLPRASLEKNFRRRVCRYLASPITARRETWLELKSRSVRQTRFAKISPKFRHQSREAKRVRRREKDKRDFFPVLRLIQSVPGEAGKTETKQSRCLPKTPFETTWSPLTRTRGLIAAVKMRGKTNDYTL